MERIKVYRSSSCIGKQPHESSQVPGIDSRTAVIDAQRQAVAASKASAPLRTISPERIAELRAIAAMHPGAHRHVERIECALRRGPLNSVEALYLGTLHIPARVQQLKKRGLEIVPCWVKVCGFDGELHRVHEWMLVAPPQPAAEVA